MKSVRRTTVADLPELARIFALSRQVMRSDGNMHQWTGGYPDEGKLREDIRRKVSYVIEDKGRIAGTFAFIPGIEPTYVRIYDGKWLDSRTLYGTIHRLAADPDCHGIADFCFEWCYGRLPNIRIDTHRDNRIMRHIVESRGFTYCGVIYLADGSERLAYQKIADVERMRADARLILPARVRSLAERYGFTVHRICIKHNRSNWGSCSSRGNLNLNLNLVRLPAELRDYVILHVLCHLREMNHGPRFHELLESLCLDLMGEKNSDRPVHLSLRNRLKGYGLI